MLLAEAILKSVGKFKMFVSEMAETVSVNRRTLLKQSESQKTHICESSCSTPACQMKQLLFVFVSCVYIKPYKPGKGTEGHQSINM